MRASFLHVADTHLGYEQYGVKERFNDFSRAFWNIMEVALERKVDFVVIAGDLFNKRAIDALTLIHAIEGLKRLKEAGIPVLAIEGNHDRSYYRDGASWLQFLCHQGYLVLLAPVMRGGSPVLEPWNPENMLGAYMDLVGGRLRVYGLPWQGAATVRSMEGLSEGLRETRSAEDEAGIEYRLLLMHTGVEGIIARVQGLPSMTQFQPLREHIDYLALGHVHKPYEFDGWMYNPGSTETCGAEESAWDRGYYIVEIDTEAVESPDPRGEAAHHRAIHHTNVRRPFVRHELHVEGINEPELLYQALEAYCRKEAGKHSEEQLRPVVQISLAGTLPFDRGELDQQRMEKLVGDYFDPLYVRVDNNTNDRDYEPEGEGLDGRDRSTWHELERRIFEDLIATDERYLPAKEKWSVVLTEMKQMALQKDDPGDIASFLRKKRQELLGNANN
ncbi:MAG TPA: exonuclease SbcCD subunit D [Ktedonobacteraceae bacterium]|nr:exonuclease SbcCD subunit D [Ktedonobacteraceae bacterium]